MPNLLEDTELQEKMIEMLCKDSNIYKFDKTCFWMEFIRHQGSENSTEHDATELKQFFARIMLPKIFTYELNSNQRSKIELLFYHPRTERTKDGFQIYMPKILERRMRATVSDIGTNILDAKDFSLIRTREYPVTYQLPRLQNSVNNIVRFKSERYKNTVFSNSTVRNRLNLMKLEYLKTGKLPEGLNFPTHQFKKKLTTALRTIYYEASVTHTKLE